MGGNREALRGLGEVLARTGREEAGVALLEKASSSFPQDSELRLALGRAHAALGLRHLKEGNREAFLEEMRRTTQLDPGNGQARYNLALDALQRGDTAAAKDHARAGLQSGYEFPPGFLQALGIDPARPGKAQEQGPPGS